MNEERFRAFVVGYMKKMRLKEETAKKKGKKQK